MDAGIIVSLVVTLFSPFLSKIGEKISEKLGEDIYPLIKPLFIKEDDNKILEKMSNNPTNSDTEIFKAMLNEKLQNNSEIKFQIAEKLTLNTSNGLEVARIIDTMQKIQSNIEEYSEMYENAGPGTTGDVHVVLTNEKRKYKKLYSELLKKLHH